MNIVFALLRIAFVVCMATSIALAVRGDTHEAVNFLILGWINLIVARDLERGT